VKNQSLNRRYRSHSPEALGQLLADYQQSGLSQRQFALQIGMGYSTLTKWIRRALQVPILSPQPKPVQFLPVQTAFAPAAPVYQLYWPHGLSLQIRPGFDPQEVQQLIALLSPCSR
jgi:hypothetical protein